MSKILNRIIEKHNLKLEPVKSVVIKDGLPLIGLNMPKCHEIAKEFAEKNELDVLIEESTYHEEKTIKGLMIGYLKLPFPEIIKLLEKFVLEVDNWAIVDTSVSNLKIFKKNLDEGLNFIEYCFSLNKTYTIRFAYVLLLSYYLDSKYLDYIFDKIRNEKSTEYYVQMAVAWLISYLYVKFPKETLTLFDGSLDKFTNNKAISKIRDSFRVTKEDKEKPKAYRI